MTKQHKQIVFDAIPAWNDQKKYMPIDAIDAFSLDLAFIMPLDFYDLIEKTGKADRIYASVFCRLGEHEFRDLFRDIEDVTFCSFLVCNKHNRLGYLNLFDSAVWELIWLDDM